MNMYRKELVFKSNKVNNVRLLCISDMHYTKYSDYKLELLNDIIDSEHPNYIVFAGDLIDSYKRIDDDSFEKIYDFFKMVTLKNKVIFIKGNHDISEKYDGVFDIEGYFNRLFELDNFYYLKDSSIEFDDICFYGYEMDNEYYSSYSKKSVNKLIDRINSDSFKDKYNVVLFHSPIHVYNRLSSIKDIDNIDLILCGHMHNGIVPYFLDNGKGDLGLLSPRKHLFPRSARNIRMYNNTRLISLYPLTFWHKLEEKNLERIYKPGYTIINIEK